MSDDPPPLGPVVIGSKLERFCTARVQLNIFLERVLDAVALADVRGEIDPRLDELFNRLTRPPLPAIMAYDARPKPVQNEIWSVVSARFFGGEFSVEQLRDLLDRVTPFAELDPSLGSEASDHEDRLSQIRDEAIRAALKEGDDPGRNISWARFREKVAKHCKVTADTRGFSSEAHFRLLVKEIRAGER